MQKQENHTLAALARLVEQFKNKPKLTAFLGVFTAAHQSVEDALWQLLTDRWIDSAAGSNLDVIGRIVGQQRDNSADDAEYGVRIKARIRSNLSSGSIENVYAVFRVLLPSSALKIAPAYPAGFKLTIGEVITSVYAALYATFLSAARAGGVGAHLLWQPQSDDETFTFETCAFLMDYFDSDPGIAVHVSSTALFPPSGSFVIDPYMPTQETVSYTSKDATHFYGVTSTQEHYPGATILTGAPTPGKGFGNVSNPSTGGGYSGVLFA